jgi:hypothetical protein
MTKRARPAFTGKVALAALKAIRRSRRSRNRRHGLWGATGISHASWLNQVEIWFSILAGKSLKGASFQAVASRFPDGAEPLPVRAEKFPVPQRREFRGNTRNLLSNSRRFFGPGRAIPRNSLSFSLLTGNLPRRQVRGGLARQPVFKPLILHLSLSLQEAYFPTNLRGLLILRCKAICSRDGFRDDFGRGRRENLSGAISWLTFFGDGASSRRQAKPKIARDAKGARGNLQNASRAMSCTVSLGFWLRRAWMW